MLNILESVFEDEMLVEKEIYEARGKVRAEMRTLFGNPPSDTLDSPDTEYPVQRSASSPGQSIKPYIPPTMPSDDPNDPFGFGEAPLR